MAPLLAPCGGIWLLLPCIDFYFVDPKCILCLAEQECRLTESKRIEYGLAFLDKNNKCPPPKDGTKDVVLQTVGKTERDCAMQCAEGHWHKDADPPAKTLPLVCTPASEENEYGHLKIVGKCQSA